MSGFFDRILIDQRPQIQVHHYEPGIRFATRDCVRKPIHGHTGDIGQILVPYKCYAIFSRNSFPEEHVMVHPLLTSYPYGLDKANSHGNCTSEMHPRHCTFHSCPAFSTPDSARGPELRQILSKVPDYLFYPKWHWTSGLRVRHCFSFQDFHAAHRTGNDPLQIHSRDVVYKSIAGFRATISR